MLEKSTFIKLNRKILKWRWYKDANTFRVFIHLILLANVTNMDFENVTVKRGQVVTSQSHLSKDLKISVRSIRTALEHLKLTGEITVKSTPKYSIITIQNYNEYQKVTRNLTGDRQATDRQATGDRQQYKNVKNVKNDKNEREGASSATPAPSKPYQLFGDFKNVRLTDWELNSLKEKYPNLYQQKIERLSSYIAISGKEYKNHYAVLLQWLAEDLAKGEQRGGKFKGNEKIKKGKGYLEQKPSYDIEELEKLLNANADLDEVEI